MSFHLDYLLDLPGVKVETCTQIEGKIYFRLSALASKVVCPQYNNYIEKLHQNPPILVRALSVFGRECVFSSAS
jgi:transposase